MGAVVGVSGAGAPDCCSSHLVQIESFFSGTMMMGPVAPIICCGAASSRLPLFENDGRVARYPS